MVHLLDRHDCKWIDTGRMSHGSQIREPETAVVHYIYNICLLQTVTNLTFPLVAYMNDLNESTVYTEIQL